MSPSQDRRPGAIAIIGGGFSGAMTAYHLVHLGGASGPRVLLFEKGERFARGLAYSTRCDGHLLNVPAGLMSALPDEPGHFLAWLAARLPGAGPGTFAPRRLYGEYLGELLDAAVEAGRGRLVLVRDEVTGLASAGPGRARLATAGGPTFEVDRAVLASGHAPPLDPPGVAGLDGCRGYVADPWSPGAFDGLGVDDPIALIGTGLTAVDLVVGARARGLRGPILALSRHGLTPQAHRPASGPPRPHLALASGPARARELVRRLRSEAAEARAQGGDWRAAVDAVRPEAAAIWGALDGRERARFLRHAAPRWEVLRHRVAPEVAAALGDERARGRLAIVAGRLVGVADRPGCVELAIRRRGEAAVAVVRAGRLINCTGPARDIAARPSPLLRGLFDSGLARPGPLALGLEVEADGAVAGSGGRLFALGPLLKEQLWETTAIRELRGQALQLARRLLAATDAPGASC